MGLQNNKNLLRVDYLHEEKERARLVSYLRDDNIRKLSGEETVSAKIKRRRFFVILIATAVILTGSLFLFL